MKKIKKFMVSHCGFVCFMMLLAFLGIDFYRGEYWSALLIVPFLITWFMYANIEKLLELKIANNVKLTTLNAKLRDKKDEAIGLLEVFHLLTLYYLHKYMKEQNAVDFCKRKTNVSDYLSKDSYYNHIVDELDKTLEKKGIKV